MHYREPVDQVDILDIIQRNTEVHVRKFIDFTYEQNTQSAETNENNRSMNHRCSRAKCTIPEYRAIYVQTRQYTFLAMAVKQ